MQELSSFSSLSQLGAGVAFALALFFKPVDRRYEKFNQSLGDALVLAQAKGRDAYEEALSQFNSRMIDLDCLTNGARDDVKIPFGIIVAGVVINFLMLVLCTVFPDAYISDTWVWVLLAMSTIPTLVGYSLIEVRAYRLSKQFLGAE